MNSQLWVKSKLFRVPGMLAIFAAALVTLSACSGDADSPEQQIREMIAAGESAVEDRKITDVLDLIAEDYQDSRGRQKQDMKRLVAGYILRNQSIHLLTRVHDVTLNEDNTRADVVLYVGMAGVPVASADQLVLTRADLYRFDLSLAREEGDWRIASGSWHQARLEDF